MNSSWLSYPASVLKATPEQIGPALAAHYATLPAEQLAVAYSCLARSVALLEEVPRGALGAALRQHLGIVAAAQAQRAASS